MIAVEDARRIVLEHCQVLPARTTTVDWDVLGCVLAEDVASDLDMPPFDKALMDGYAVRVADVTSGTDLPVVGTVMAGQIPLPLPPGSAIGIMTGAPIPAGADAVIRLEDATLLNDSRVCFARANPMPGQNILRQGAEMRCGEVVLRQGTRITPQVAGLLAAVGRSHVRIIPRPEVAILSTGDELVPPDEVPGPGQLRNSNGVMLACQARRAGAIPRLLGIAHDRRDELQRRIEDALRSDIVVLSGGVSMGKLDLVPDVLCNLGVVAHIHQVAMKPGKPFLFGTFERRLIFGLPGNPVSSYCCFELFVRPAIRSLSGHPIGGPTWDEAELAEDFQHRSDRPTFHPAVRTGATVRPVAWLGSPDLRALAGSNALIQLPPGSHIFPAGSRLPVLDIGE
jgi:molybdopterin molybdotransferase